jgi:hypothetical protein
MGIFLSISCPFTVRLRGRIQAKSDQFGGSEPDRAVDTILLICYTSVTSITSGEAISP